VYDTNGIEDLNTTANSFHMNHQCGSLLSVLRVKNVLVTGIVVFVNE